MEGVRLPIWQWVIVALVGLLIWQLIMNMSAVVVVALSSAGLLEQAKTWLPAITAIAALLAALPLFQLLYLWPGRGLSTIGVTTKNLLSDVLLGTVVGAVQSAIALFVVIPALGALANDALAPVRGLMDSPARLMASIVLVVVYGGVVEEIFFRGHVITSVSKALGSRAWSVAIAAVVSVVLFSIAHRYQGEIGIAYAAAAASIYAALYLLTGRLAASMAAHAVYDLLTLFGVYTLYPGTA